MRLADKPSVMLWRMGRLFGTIILLALIYFVLLPSPVFSIYNYAYFDVNAGRIRRTRCFWGVKFSDKVEDGSLTRLYKEHITTELPAPVWIRFASHFDNPFLKVGGHSRLEKFIWNEVRTIELFEQRIIADTGTEYGSFGRYTYPPTNEAWAKFINGFLWLMRNDKCSDTALNAARTYSTRFQDLVYASDHALKASEIPAPKAVYDEAVKYERGAR